MEGMLFTQLQCVEHLCNMINHHSVQHQRCCWRSFVLLLLSALPVLRVELLTVAFQ
jgi:hypothetical protein